MFTKIIIAGIIGTTGLVGTGSTNNIAPTGMELTAGPLHIESGNGKGFTANFDQPAPVSFTVHLPDNKKLQIKF